MFRKAEKSKSKLRLAITGPAGSGKTYSALQVAFGIGGKIGLICTEHGSGELYSTLGDYDIAELTPPFTIDKYIKLIKEAEQNYDVIIIDSLSHAWAGEGGLLEQHDKLTAASKTGNSYTTWGKITPLQNQLVETILQSKSHIIATMRTKTEYSITNENGKQVPKKIGMAPIQRDGMDYEFSVVYDLSVDHIATVTKDRTNIFSNLDPFKPSAETGKILLEWLNTGVDTKTDSQKYAELPEDTKQRFEKLGLILDRQIAGCIKYKWDVSVINAELDKMIVAKEPQNKKPAEPENLTDAEKEFLK